MSSIFSGINGGGGGSGSTIAIGVDVDGQGAQIQAGTKSAGLAIPFNCILRQAELLADQVGSIVMDIWKAPYASYPPTGANSIVGAAPPTISSDIKSLDSTLAGWTINVNAGDVLIFSVTSVTAIHLCSLSLAAIKV
jgi:hypothetical protein